MEDDSEDRGGERREKGESPLTYIAMEVIDKTTKLRKLHALSPGFVIFVSRYWLQAICHQLSGKRQSQHTVTYRYSTVIQ